MKIECPNCTTTFELNDVIAKEKLAELKLTISKEKQEELEREKQLLRDKMNQFILENEQKANEDKKQNDLANEKKLILIKEKARNEINAELEFLKIKNEENEQQLKLAKQKDIDILTLKDEVKTAKSNAEHEIKKAILENEQILKDKFEKEMLPKLTEKMTLSMKEKDTQLESMKKKIEDLMKKSEQGSMQLQGEAQELLLEEMLQDAFPYDKIGEVGKGVRGADCLQNINNTKGNHCGIIIYESKRTKEWKNEWIDKLKADSRQVKADIAVIVTQTMPKDIVVFGMKDGIWVCSFAHAIPLAIALRNGIIKIAETKKSQENKGEKMEMLYSYLTGNDFTNHIEAIAEGFKSMRDSITKERMQMEKLWKEREQQLNKVLLNTSGLYGSIKGIAGGSMGNIQLLDGED